MDGRGATCASVDVRRDERIIQALERLDVSQCRIPSGKQAAVRTHPGPHLFSSSSRLYTQPPVQAKPLQEREHSKVQKEQVQGAHTASSHPASLPLRQSVHRTTPVNRLSH